MKKLLCLLIFVSLLFPAPLKASEEASYSVNVVYDVTQTGVTNVKFEIEIENLVTEKYTKDFNISFTGVHPENIKAVENLKTLPTTLKDEDGFKKIVVDFPEAMVGKGKKRNFEVNFEDKTLVTKSGEVWEVTLPQIKNINDFDYFHSDLIVPFSFGNLAYVSPEPDEQFQDGNAYFFEFKSEAYKKGAVSLAFGEFQVFSFNLIYHLENPVSKDTNVEIAIPPDTAFQKVMYQSISPRPVKIDTDIDGNWIATYALTARQKMDVTVSGLTQLYAAPRELPNGPIYDLAKFSSPKKYWESDDPLITNVAKNLNNPKDIYEYVINALSYDYARAVPNVQRLGAKGALLTPNSAICMEFTDLFVALARAKGIPAREVNGFAYAENTSLQPLSLVADVLHAWPEYWDSQRGAWIPVDPTWGDTSNLDYFSKLDLRHFTFVIHGMDSEKPYPPGSYKLGPNPQKDVYVAFAKLPNERLAKLTTAIGQPKGISLNTSGYRGVVVNDGPVAVYDQKVKVMFDDDEVYEETIPVLFPFDRKEIPVNVKFGVLGEKAPYKISLIAGDAVAHTDVNKTKVVVTRVTALFIIILLAVSVLFYKILRSSSINKGK